MSKKGIYPLTVEQSAKLCYDLCHQVIEHLLNKGRFHSEKEKNIIKTYQMITKYAKLFIELFNLGPSFTISVEAVYISYTNIVLGSYQVARIVFEDEHLSQIPELVLNHFAHEMLISGMMYTRSALHKYDPHDITATMFKKHSRKLDAMRHKRVRLIPFIKLHMQTFRLQVIIDKNE